PISLAEMDGVALQNRTDTKYLISIDVLIQALSMLADEYRVLEINSLRQSPYQTLYFDTPDFALYMSHHAGQANRFKVRSRRYVGTDQSFMEVKLKTNKDRTIKQRIPTDRLNTACTPEMADFIADHTDGQVPELEPKLWNEFSRVTLVGASERVTIDLDLRFRGNGECIAMPGIAIVEVKQDGVSRSSAFIQQLHAANVQPTGFSKYCIGISLIYPEVKHNRFKPKLLQVKKLMGVSSYVN
ncbi:MAG: polyphosphate polymerase domain-containing protein, partial [Oscillochloris sp.]|nr:polyphosphate polymerase domain-containing protein [Oscillochloris sp.]